MHPSCWKYGKYFLIIVVLLSLSIYDSAARSKTIAVESIRVADFVHYTHIAIELNGKARSVEFHPYTVGDYQILTVKMKGVHQGNIPDEIPVDSDVLVEKIAVDYKSGVLSLSVPCQKSADLSRLEWHTWDEMLTIDIPLNAPNHSRVPSADEIKKFRESGGKVVILDAGHGGFDSGAVPRYVKSPLQEKNVALELAKLVERLFQQNPKIRVYMTRYGDYLPVPFGLKGRSRKEYKDESLRYRVQLAKEYLGDVYVSIHLNAPPNSYRSSALRAKGFEIYYLGETHANLIKNQDVEDLTNLGVEEQQTDDNLSSLVLGMLKDNIPQYSMDLAGLVKTEMERIPWLEIRDPAMKSQRFTVIKQLLMPSVLVECLFITNPTEHEQIRDTKKRTQIANALYSAVCKFFFEPSAPIQVAVNAEALKKPAPETAPTPILKNTSKPKKHTVRRNETLGIIAAKYGVSLPRLRNMNRGKIGRGDVIQLGEVLEIPSDKASPITVPSQKTPIREIYYYVVKSGDSVDRIANLLGTTVDVLKDLNHYTTRNPKIYPGDKIKVPASGKVNVASARSYKSAVHTVKSGESLDKIAKKYRTTVYQLKKLNGLKARNPRIYPGDKIKVR